jgi:NAD(P)H-dependent FMN reductase
MTKIAIIIGSTRPGRNGQAVAEWVLEQAKSRTDAQFEIVDLKDFDLPHLDEAAPAAFGQYANDHTKKWSATIADYDGYIFVTPEYNHSTSGALKNALDFLYNEWNNKAAAFVSYGSLGGARAVEHLRLVAAELQLATVRQQLGFSLMTDFENFSTFTPADHHLPGVTTMFDQLVSWAEALRSVRESAEEQIAA